MKRSDRPPEEKPSFHFHEMVGFANFRTNEFTDYCAPTNGRIFGPVELALECVRCKVLKDSERFRRIKKILIEHRVNIEAELRKVGKGIWPLPHVVMERLLGEKVQ